MTLATQQHGRQPVAISSVTQLLTANMKAIQSCLPKHMTPERMCRIAVQTISKSEKLQKCSPQSLVAAIVEASSLGLEIDVRGQAYLVPYGTTVTLIPGYKGLMDLAYRSGRVANIYAETVCENDEFVYELGLAPKLTHKPNLDERGKLRAVYAVARLKDADPVFVVLGKKDVEKVRKASKTSGSGPWQSWEEEMWKKTAIRRLCKYLPLSPEMQRAVAIDEAADAGVPQHLGEAIIDLPPESFAENGADALNAALEAAPQAGETIDMQPAAEPAPAETVNPETGEVTPAHAARETATAPQPEAAAQRSSFLITCPKNGNQVDELECQGKPCRSGCPEFE